MMIEDETFFEGPEKTLEVIFHPGFGVEAGLKTLTREQLNTICDLAKCTILSHISSHEMDAYLLSESSLFIYKDKFIMKTCGTTTLLHCLQTLLEYADALQMVLCSFIYFRKNLKQPASQMHPHHSFESEIEYINTHAQMENRLPSKCFLLGPLNGDHLFIYMAHMCPLKRESMNQYMLSFPTVPPSSSSQKSSLNLMMFGLDPDFSRHFFEKNTSSAKEMTQNSGLASLILGTTIDEKAFSPCGYSMNAVSNHYYYTVHITPQESCSYASFETNVDLASYNSLVSNIVSLFRPEKFIVTLFGSKPMDPFSKGSLNYQCSTSSTVKLDSEENCYMAVFSLL